MKSFCILLCLSHLHFFFFISVSLKASLSLPLCPSASWQLICPQVFIDQPPLFLSIYPSIHPSIRLSLHPASLCQYSLMAVLWHGCGTRLCRVVSDTWPSSACFSPAHFHSVVNPSADCRLKLITPSSASKPERRVGGMLSKPMNQTNESVANGTKPTEN